MTSIDFLNKVHKSLDSQEYSLSYSPAKSKNYMLYCNGNFIGGLFDEELCFVYADSVSELLGQPEPVYRGYSSTAQHRMLVIPEEHWAKALKLLYAEKFDWSRLVYDITYTSIGAAVVEDFYDENVVFLRFFQQLLEQCTWFGVFTGQDHRGDDIRLPAGFFVGSDTVFFEYAFRSGLTSASA